ncbi:MAG: hypothetical protein IKG93_03390 [Clostridiales bacterium]|nr:hypothetical protein [Clostridiales bacterium]
MFRTGTYRRRTNPVVLIAFGVVIVLIVACMIYGMKQTSHQAEDIEKARAAITLTKEGGKTVINDALLRADYSVFAKNQGTNKTVFTIMMIGIGVLFAVVIGNMVFQTIRSLRNNDSGQPVFMKIIMLVFTLGVAVLTIVFLTMFFGRGKIKSSPSVENAVISVSAKDITHKDSKTVKSGTRKHRTTTTYYYLYTASGEQIKVSSYLYSLVSSSGKYYLAKNQNDQIFYVYSASEYCLEGETVT